MEMRLPEPGDALTGVEMFAGLEPQVRQLVIAAAVPRTYRKGQLLFQIDPRPFDAEADRLRAELTRAEAVVRRADSEFSRAGRLQAENAIAHEEFERRAAFRDESRAQLAAVQAALRAAELNLEFTRVTSPIAGRVGRAVVELATAETGRVEIRLAP